MMARVATLGLALFTSTAAARGVKTGIDVLAGHDFRELRGRKIGLITNHSGFDRQGRRTIDLLAGAPGVALIAIFSPEHGLAGDADAPVNSTRDPKTGLPVHSLYGSRKVLEAIKAGQDPLEIERLWQSDLAAFRTMRAQYLLYR